MNGCAFLSCLCGSEPDLTHMQQQRDFLSCLCGSELPGLQSRGDSNFLSCLCGSERLLGEPLRMA